MRNWFKYLGLGLAVLLALPAVGGAVVPTEVKSFPLAVNWDVDGEAADADQIVAGPDALADSTSYTIDAQPDVCRLVDITLVDNNGGANITAGTITVTGTDCWGDTLVGVFTFTAGDDTGIKPLVIGAAVPPSTNLASAAYFKTVATVITSALTGEGAGDTLIVGYTTNSQNGYSLYGIRKNIPASPWRVVDLNSVATVNVPIRAATSPTTGLTAAVALTSPFAHVAVGDLIAINPPGGTMPVQWRKIVTWTDADNIVVDVAVPITTAAAGQGFSYKKAFLSTDPQDGWINMQGWDGANFLWHETSTGANTGGLVSAVECTFMTSEELPSIVVDTDTIASGSAGAAASSIDLRLAPYDFCRLGLKFGTGDDVDATAANTEAVYISIGLSK